MKKFLLILSMVIIVLTMCSCGLFRDPADTMFEGPYVEDPDGIVTYYTQAHIDNSGGKLVAIGKKDPLNVVAAFNDNWRNVTITKNGADSDGVMRNWSSYSPSNPFCANATLIESVTIKEGVVNVGDYAFYDCSFLDEGPYFSAGLKKIGDHAFQRCTGIKSVVIPDSVTTIGKEAFRDCISLKSITLPDGLTNIGDFAFENTDYYNQQNKQNDDENYSSNAEENAEKYNN